MKYWSCCAILAGLLGAGVNASSQNPPFTVEDDIAMVRFSDPYPRSAVPGSDILPRSPDGRYFAMVTTKGLLKSDEIESQISIFDRDVIKVSVQPKVLQYPSAPRVIATIVGSPNYEASHPAMALINDLQWSSDMTRVYFKGENRQGAYQLFVAMVDGSGFHALTPPNHSVDHFDIEGDTIAYTASLPATGSLGQGIVINRDVLRVTGYDLRDIVFPGQLSSINPETFSLWVMKRSHGEWKAKQITNFSVREERYLSHLYPLKLSPKGDKLIGRIPVAKVPALWNSYDPAFGYEYLRLRSDAEELTGDNNIGRPQEYSLIDLVSGKSMSLVNAPIAWSLAYLDSNRLVWSSDEKRVLVTNTFLPIDQGTPSERLQRTKPCAVASVDVVSLNVQCLRFIEPNTASQPSTDHVLDVAFGADDSEVLLLVDPGSGKRAEEKFSFRNATWKLTSSIPVSPELNTLQVTMTDKDASVSDLQLLVKQGLNDPPTVWAQDLRTGGAKQLWDPNPEFAHIRFGRTSVYRWKDKTDREWTGGLVEPVSYVAGHRYPLVVQMYDFYDGQFMTDGTDPTAFAARELASAGFMVLQIQKKPDTLTDADPEIHLEGYRSGVEHLDAAGLIDASKVGVVGFSWTCWYVEYALIKAPHLFAAATIADGLDNSYMDYHLFAVDSTLRDQMEKIHGAKPFGEGLKTWFEMAPGFHLEQVRTPLRIEAINPLSVLGEWEIYSSLRIQNKPVDLIYFPHGTHIHQKPLERLESQQGDVDWMRFWLQGYEDPDPTKKAQYDRWRQLRTLKESNDKAAMQSEPNSTKTN
jgi:dipeptidyl aminopeptidase/acylaminoacyl peptidase